MYMMEEDVINPELEEKDCLMRFIMARQHDWAGQYKCSTDDAEEDAAGQDVQNHPTYSPPSRDSPITFNAFKLNFDSTDEKDRRLYVIHAHPYFAYSTEADQEKAHKFRAAIKFQISFTKYHLVDVLPWLMFNRPEEFSILVHPFTAKPVEDHQSSAVWLGKQLQCHLQPMEQLQQHVATEVQAGKDEAALLWRFV
ncbi:hypothetical protein WJX77_004191 [Trebouxia sp. C0004]